MVLFLNHFRLAWGGAQDSILRWGCLCCASCLVPCACGSLHAGHANASLIQCQAQKCQKRTTTTARGGREEGEGRTTKNAAHIRTRKTGNWIFDFAKCVAGRGRTAAGTVVGTHKQHTHIHTHMCVPGCCNYYERSERTPDTGSASFCIPSSRQTVQTETKYLTTMHPGYSPEGLHNWVGVAAPHETATVKEKRREGGRGGERGRESLHSQVPMTRAESCHTQRSQAERGLERERDRE